MRKGVVLSSILHFGVILATVYGLPQIWDPLEIQEQQIIVELVTVAERTTLQKPLEKDEKKELPPAPEVKQAKKPKLAPEQVKTPPPPQKSAKMAPPPVPKVTKGRLLLKNKTKSKSEDIPIRKPKSPKLPKEKPELSKLVAKSESKKIFRNLPRPRSKPQRQRLKFDAERIAALLDMDDEKKPQTRLKKTNWKKTVKELSSKITPSPERLRTAPMTTSEIAAIQSQIYRCWTIPAGARDAENLIIQIRFFLNADGSLSKAPEIVDAINKRNNPFYVTAAESARRAVLKCAPLKNLPVEKYAHWREITLKFNPREALGG